jgi:hypothetical protein
VEDDLDQPGGGEEQSDPEQQRRPGGERDSQAHHTAHRARVALGPVDGHEA